MPATSIDRMLSRHFDLANIVLVSQARRHPNMRGCIAEAPVAAIS